MALDNLDIDFSGTTDANGNLTISKTPSPAYWAAIKLVSQVSGNAIWIVQVDGRAVTFGRGPRVDLGPILLQPKQTITLLVSSALPNAALSGKLLGITAGSVGEVLANFSMVPNTITVDTASPTIPLATIVAPAGGGTQTRQLILPPGTQAVGFSWDETGANNAPTSVTITGNPTGTLYFPGIAGTSFFGSTGGLEVVSVNGVDTAITVQVTPPGGLQSTVYVQAWTASPVVFLRVIDGQALPVTRGPLGQGEVNANGNIGTGSLAAGASLTVLGGGGIGVHTRPHKVQFSTGPAAGCFGTVECPAGTTIASWDGGFSHAIDLDFEGFDCGSNTALVVHNTSGVASGVLQGHGTANQS